MEIIPFINAIWSGPFQFALAIYFLYDLVGVSAFAGLAVFFVLVPINIFGGKRGQGIQVGQMKAKDGRILFMNEILQGMKVLKLYAWEKPFMQKVKEFRDLEIVSIKKNAILQACLWITYTAAPLVVTVCSSEEEFQALAMRLAVRVLLPGTGWIALKQLMDLVDLTMDLLGKIFLPRGSLA